MPHPLDDTARTLFVAAATEGRCGELLDALFHGATATVDPLTRSLVIIKADALAAAFAPDDRPDPEPPTPLAFTTVGLAGETNPADQQPQDWSRVTVPYPPGTLVAVARPAIPTP